MTWNISEIIRWQRPIFRFTVIFYDVKTDKLIEVEKATEIGRAKQTPKRKAADFRLRLLRACGNIHEDMHKPVDKFEDGTFPCFSYMVY